MFKNSSGRNISEWFAVNVGVHQGLISSPFLFAVVWHEITKDVRGGLLKEIFYVDDFLETAGRKWGKNIQDKKNFLKKKGLILNCTGKSLMQKLTINYTGQHKISFWDESSCPLLILGR